MNRHRAPQPPDGVYPIGNRLLRPIPSVPELQSYRDRCLAYTFLDGVQRGIGDGWYTTYRDLERAEQALDDARWRLACASWGWVRDPVQPDGPGDDFWWVMVTAIAAQRYTVMNGEFYYPPGKALAIRSTTEVVT